jgi:hypothetical protein
MRQPSSRTPDEGKVSTGEQDGGQADRRMVAMYRRQLRRTRNEDEVAVMLAAVFGVRLLPASVLARLRTTRRSTA